MKQKNFSNSPRIGRIAAKEGKRQVPHQREGQIQPPPQNPLLRGKERELLSKAVCFLLSDGLEPSRIGWTIRFPNKTRMVIQTNRCAHHNTETNEIQKQPKIIRLNKHLSIIILNIMASTCQWRDADWWTGLINSTQVTVSAKSNPSLIKTP